MTPQKKREMERLFDAILKVLEDPRHLASSTLSHVYGHPDYALLVGQGLEALPFCVEKIREGHFVLNRAFLEIAGMKASTLIGPVPVGERALSDAIVRWWDYRLAHAAAASTVPTGLPPPSAFSPGGNVSTYRLNIRALA